MEENKTRKAEAMPSDELYDYQWALPQIGWDMVFDTVVPSGESIVAVLDTGVDASHEELIDKLVTCNSILNGSDCTSDPHGHGTWLAGIVAANTDNNNGIAGVGYDGVKIMPVTVLNADGTGQDSDIIAGVVWAVENGADVILMGFSNPGFSQNLQDAIDYAWENNVILVAATGNDGISDPTFPAGDRGVIGVSATDQSDNFVSFSNYGQDVFLAAPGLDIETTDTSNSFVSISGTSSSAAIVAGAAAFMRAVEPDLSNGVIVGRLARNADPAGDPVNDPDVQLKFGNGRINMARALSDTSLEEVQPAGAEPVGDGGPYVGPYKIASSGYVEGTVRDASTNNPISGASVSVDCTPTSCNDTPLIVSTIADGTYSAHINWSGTGQRSGTVSVTASGYSSSGSTNWGPINNGGRATVNFNLTPSCTAPSITTHPSDQTVTYGVASVSFSAAASGDPSPTVQWQVSTNSGSTWGDIGGATSTTLTITTPTVAMSGYKYHAVFTNTCGGTQTATTTAATLTVSKADATCSVSGYTGTYDATAHGASGSCTGIGGATLTGLDLGSTFTDVPGGTANWTFSNTNYNDQNGSVAIVINKASSTTTVTVSDATYDGNPHGGTANVTGAGGLNQAVTVNYAGRNGTVYGLSTTPPTNAGGYQARATFAGDSNHTGSQDSKPFSIKRATLTITANDVTKTYGDTVTFAGTEFTPNGLISPDTITSVTLTSAGAPASATVAGSTYAIVPSAAVFGTGSASNYTITYINGLLTVTPREGFTSYIGQTLFVTSGSSSTTAQVTLSASVQDPDGSSSVANATVTFKDLLSGKILAKDVKVSLVSNTDTSIGTANTIVTLSTGQYGAQSYLIEVSLGSSYKNDQQTGATPGTAPYEAAHPSVTVMIPATKNSLQGTGTPAKLTTAAGVYGDAMSMSYTAGMVYNNKGTNPQGKIEVIITRPDGVYYIKSNSITSVAFSNPVGGVNKDVTIYTKANISKITAGGVTTTIDGNVTLRMDAHDGGSSDDTIGFTVLSTKDSTLYYSNNWVYDPVTKSWRTIKQSVNGALAIVIN